ncbi:DoxX family protein [Janibacter sp. YB324]|uniref:DoxX family protein n=1 Tax=Janibacter sp. YB324 TaxID=2761047 RepID=UPI00162AA35E|nr:DoxX family protein [Janibacter sp. YB324]QNF94925.1 DoxX family protein [Janibacter sp. YB324]
MIVRRIARPMLAGIFVWGGINALRYPSAHVPAAEPVTKPLATKTQLPDDTELLVRANGAAMVAGGALLATGKAPRLASALLLGTMVPTTATHNFWAESDPQAKAGKLTQFIKDVSLMGGLILAAVDTEGKPGVAYRAKLAGEGIERTARQARKSAAREAKLAALQAKQAVS